jgi:hypothetical protein
VLVVTGDGTEPPPLAELLAKPGLSAAFEIEAGMLDWFMSNPLLAAYFDSGVPVIAAFADEGDAIEFQIRTGLLPSGGRA